MPNLGRTVFASVVSALFASGGLAAQADPVSDDPERLLDRAARLDVRNATLFVSLKNLQARSGVSLVYSPSKLPRDHRVSCACHKVPVRRALDELLAGTGLRYVVIGSHIVIEPESSFVEKRRTTADAQRSGRATEQSATTSTTRAGANSGKGGVVRTGDIAGVVVDAATRRPLNAANVMIDGTQHGTVTREDGRYALRGVPAGTTDVRVSRIGYGSRTGPVSVGAGEVATMVVALPAQAVQLDEVVAIGYGTALRRDLTGSVTVVAADELATGAAPSPTFAHSLQGRAAGVRVVSNSGMPGAGLRVRVRGTNSINATSEPLYVLDGLPLNQESISSDPTINPLVSIDADDIASIQVLKDASATAVYGARGANGVVLITTRRGRRGENRVSLESSYGVQQIARQIDVLNAQDFMRITNLARANADQPALFTNEQISNAQTFDYPSQITQTAPQTRHSLSVSGGSESVRYRVGGSYTMQEGVVIGADFERIGGRLNLDANVSDRFRVGTRLNVARVVREAAAVENGSLGNSANGIQAAMQFAPFQSPRDSIGGWVKTSPTTEPVSNPLADVHELLDRNLITRLVGAVYGELDITPALRLNGRIGGDYELDRHQFFAPRTIRAGGVSGVAWIDSGERREWNSMSSLTYHGALGPGWLELLGGIELTRSYDDAYAASATGFPTDETSIFDLESGARPGAPSSSVAEWVLLSNMARANYSLFDRYLFTVTGRYDGSSRFGANDKWAFFPSAAFAWRVSEEPFMRDQDLFSDLKLRISYGSSGNQGVAPYNSLSRLITDWYAFGDTELPALAPSTVMPNPDLRWEQQRQFNAGIDATFARNRIALTLDAYHSRTDDLLFNVTVPVTTGFTQQLRNIGSVENRGLELSLSTVNVETGDFRWRSTFNIAGNRNEVVDLGPEEEIVLTARSGNFLGSTHVLRVGEPLGSIFGYEVDGLFQQRDDCYLLNEMLCAPGELKVIDQNGDGEVTGADRVILGHAEPRFHGGLSNRFRYGPLTLEASLSFVQGNQIINAGAAYGELAIMQTNERAVVRDHWTPDNPNTTIPRPRADRKRLLYSTFVEDGSYVRLQTLALGYQLPAALLPPGAAARLYITGQNLWVGTDYGGFDPDVNSMGSDARMGGIDIGAYPHARVWNVGVNVVF